MRNFLVTDNQFKWYTSPLLFASVFTILLVILYPSILNSYRIDIRLLPKSKLHHNHYLNFKNNKFSKSVSFSINNNNCYFLNIDGDKHLLRAGYSAKLNNIFTIDYNNDNYKEIYFCTEYKDSLFVSSFDFKDKEISYKYVGKIEKTIKKRKSVFFLSSYDYNNDSFKEIYFCVNGQTHAPLRSIIRYDIKNSKLKFSSHIPSVVIDAFSVKKDGKLRLVYTTWGLRKTSKYIPDKEIYEKAQFSMLDEDLEPVFTPKKYDGVNKVIGCMKVRKSGVDYVWIFIDSSYAKAEKSKDRTLVEIYSLDGKLVNSNFINYDVFIIKNAYFSLGDTINENAYITIRSGGLLKMNFSLKYSKRVNIKNIQYPMLAFAGDIDGDGSKELLFHDNSRKNNVIVKKNFSKPVYFVRPEPFDMVQSVALIGRVRNSKHNSIGHCYFNSHVENLYFESKFLSLFLKYYSDSKHWYQYIYLTFFFVFVYLSMLSLRYLVARSMRDKYEVKNRIAELRFKNISNQMSPHFTMNAMNSIASLIFKDDKYKAYDFLSKLAKLMKMSLLDANKSTRSLGEEMSFVKAYLELQKLRFRDRFDFTISCPDDCLSTLNIMPFMVQTFVENSIKHGILGLSKKGVLKIYTKSKDRGVIISIEDNGVGRKAAMLNKSIVSTGQGVKLVKEYIDILNKKDKRNMKIEIIDLYKDDEPAGTLVEIFIDYFEGEE
ncbi:MAG: histidine kinase [Marinifilaceae bacterium]